MVRYINPHFVVARLARKVSVTFIYPDIQDITKSFGLKNSRMTKMMVTVALILMLSICVGALRGRGGIRMVSKYITSKKPIFIAGGSNGVGKEVVKRLTSMGNPVKCLVRREESVAELKAIGGDLVTCQLGDAMDESDVQSCMEGCIAAVTTLGGKPVKEGGPRVDYVGNSNVVEQAGILGCERIVLVTTIGCGKTKAALSDDVYSVLEDAIKAKDKAERDCRMYTNLDWTIIRPGGLKSESATGTAVLTENCQASGVVNREDVAAMIVKVLESEGKATRKELSCLDPGQVSDYNSAGQYEPYVV